MHEIINEMQMKTWSECWPGERPPRFLKPFLLLLLLQKESHGYELFERLKNMGLDYETQDAGYVYRKLRIMESEGLIISEWDTEGIGAAKRVYKITPDGLISLGEWAKSIGWLKTSLEIFLESYRAEESKL
ncbi:MAG: PadR family transcriptional regulator [Spirochaetes bacterium]|nr:PadR family transcriptional regulator [Spirochaetota bacterium]